MGNFEGSHLRKTYRLKLPAEVIINNKKFTVLDWSYAGFRIKKSLDDIFEDREYSLNFVLHFEGFSVDLKAKAKPKWQKEEEAGFEFSNLPDSAKKVMKEYMEAFIEGRLTDIGGVISEIELSTVLPDVEPPLDKNLQKKLDKKLFLTVFFYFFLSLILIIILYKGFSGTQKVYSIDAKYIADISYITLEEDAKITKLFVQQGQEVKIGEKLFEVSVITQQNPNLDLNIEKSKIEYETTKYTVDREIVNLAKEKEIINTNIDFLKKQLKELEDKINIYKEALEKGYLSYSYLENLNLEKQKLLEQIKTSQLKLHQIDIEIKNLYKQKDILNKGYNNISSIGSFSEKNNKKLYFSNINGRILNIQTTESSIHKAGFPVIIIEQTQNKGCFMARFDPIDGKYIKVGDIAHIYIPSRNEEIKGTVLTIGKMAFKEYRYIPEFEEYDLQDLAVKICAENIPNSLKHGEKAEIQINVKRLPWLLESIYNIIKR